MPTLDDALRFARDPHTDAEKLRQACSLLEIAVDGEPEQVRARLEAHLRGLDQELPVVCLNPRRPPEPVED